MKEQINQDRASPRTHHHPEQLSYGHNILEVKKLLS